ncbi:MAG: ABC transporter permease [Planctomycetes bacterium]|nr:ABC transporter permease [Planctomycetota bacterium]
MALGPLSDLLELRFQPPRVVRWLLGLGSVLLVLLVWWFITRGEEPELRIVSPVTLPSPGEVWDQAASLFTERQLLQSVAATLQRVFLGFGLAILVGVPFGVLAGSWRGIEAFLAPISLFGRNIPIAALIPLTLFWFGAGEEQKVMFIFIACVPFVFGNAVQAILDVESQYVETALTLGASRLQIVLKVLVPLALPSIYNGLRILFGLAFGYIMLAEVIDAKHGLGHLINASQKRGLTEHIYLILLLIGLTAYTIDRILWWFQRGLFPHTIRERE